MKMYNAIRYTGYAFIAILFVIFLAALIYWVSMLLLMTECAMIVKIVVVIVTGTLLAYLFSRALNALYSLIKSDNE